MGRSIASHRGPARWIGVLIAALVMVAVVPTGAQASSSSDFVAKINAARQSHGTKALTVRGDLAAAAQVQAERMADRSDLFHNPDLGGSVSHWSALAENVGYGPDVAAIHTGFMNSPGHRTNILNAKYTEVGVGVVVRNHVMWVAEVFRRPSGETSGSGSGGSATAAPKKKPASAPKKSPGSTSGPTEPRVPAAKSRAANKAAPAKSGPMKALARAAQEGPREIPALPIQAERVLREGAPLIVDAVTSSTLPATGAVSPPEGAGLPTGAAVTLGLLALVVIGGAARLRVLG